MPIGDSLLHPRMLSPLHSCSKEMRKMRSHLPHQNARKYLKWQPLLGTGYEIQAGIEIACLIHIITNANKGR